MFVSNGKGVQFIDMASATVYQYDLNHFLSEDSPNPLSKLKLSESVDSEMQMLGDYYVGYQYFKEDLLFLFDNSSFVLITVIITVFCVFIVTYLTVSVKHLFRFFLRSPAALSSLRRYRKSW